MKTISFEVSDEEYEQALFIVRHAYAASCPGFDVGKLAALGHGIWMKQVLPIARRAAAEGIEGKARARKPAAAAASIARGPWRQRTV